MPRLIKSLLAKLPFRRKKPENFLSQREEEILKRESEESSKHAMPDLSTNNTFGDGSFINNISRIQSTSNQNGLGAIIERRVFEPREGQSKGDKESL